MTDSEIQSLIASLKIQAVEKITNNGASLSVGDIVIEEYTQGVEEGIDQSMVVFTDYLRAKG